MGSDDLTRMLGGHGVPPEMVGIVAEMAATPSMRSTPTQFERDPLYDTDGEDLSDPIYQVDLRVSEHDLSFDLTIHMHL